MDAIRFHEVLPGVLEASAFSPAHKVDLTMHAVRTRSGWVVVDPTGDPGSWPAEAPAAVVLTGGNHVRDAARWGARWRCPVHAPGPALAELPGAVGFPPAGTGWSDGWEAVPLDGGGPGETAFRIPSLDLVVFGDAVVNLAGRGLELLPDKYCADPAALRRALRALLSRPFGRAVLAHGDAVLASASDRIAALL